LTKYNTRKKARHADYKAWQTLEYKGFDNPGLKRVSCTTPTKLHEQPVLAHLHSQT
jgi:hypothetical protein